MDDYYHGAVVPIVSLFLYFLLWETGFIGIWERQTRKSAMDNLVGPVMGLHQGQGYHLHLFVYCAGLLPWVFLGQTRIPCVQLYVVLSLLALTAWLQCVHVACAQLGYNPLTMRRRSGARAPCLNMYVVWSLMFGVCAVVTAITFVMDYDTYSYISVVFLLWTLLTTTAAAASWCASIRRAPRLAATKEIEVKRAAAVSANNRTVRLNPDTDTLFVPDAESKQLSDSEIELVGFTPLSVIVLAVLMGLGVCLLVGFLLEGQAGRSRLSPIDLVSGAFGLMLASVLGSVVAGRWSSPEPTAMEAVTINPGSMV